MAKVEKVPYPWQFIQIRAGCTHISLPVMAAVAISIDPYPPTN